MADREKILDKLKKMYAHSKSAEAIGSEDEAQAFAAKIQELLSMHKIEMSEVEYGNLDETDPVGRRLVDFRSAGIRVVRRRVEWHEYMANFTCRAYFCRTIVITGSSELYFVGRGSDIDAAEQVFLYLVRVASNLADKAYVKFFYEMRAIGMLELARGFRASFLAGFSERLSERYEQERAKIVRQQASSGTALIRLTDALRAVDAYLTKAREAGTTRRAPGLGSTKDENLHGYKQGRKEADELPIGDDMKQVEK